MNFITIIFGILFAHRIYEKEISMKLQLQQVFSTHENMLNLRAKRTEILASNLVNADTPGYKAKDIDFKQALEDKLLTSNSQLRTTHSGHISTSDDLDEFSLMYSVPTQPSLDGNTVDTQIENAKFSENTIRYLASLRFLDSKIKGMAAAIKGE
tara:strand:+ start:72047 stop:72508 length:462 start_codon:yes stop_codon:yes gene_type:complete